MSDGLPAAISSSRSVSRGAAFQREESPLRRELPLANKMRPLFPQSPGRPWSLPCALPGITLPNTQDPRHPCRGNKPAFFIPTSRSKQESSDGKDAAAPSMDK